jgi:hypothetical protein
MILAFARFHEKSVQFYSVDFVYDTSGGEIIIKIY